MATFNLYILMILANIYGCICGNSLFEYDDGSFGYYLNEIKWIAPVALAFIVIINLMICSVYWCCTKERWSAQSAKKVMTTF